MLRDRDPSDPHWKAVELAQRAQMIRDVAAADLEAAEAAYGAIHATTWHFRTARDEAFRAWDRLRAELGPKTIADALREPPLTVLTLGPASREFAPDRSGRWPLPEPVLSDAPGALPTTPILLIPIAGQTYRVLRVPGTPLAPLIWHLTRLNPPLADGPYYACRLPDGNAHCDCADWIYQRHQSSTQSLCKHLAALASLGWA